MPFKIGFFSLAACIAGTIAMSAAAEADGAAATPASEHYDADLAQALGADDYGMRPYVLVVLKTGPVEITDEARRAEIFAGHFANMKRLAEAEKLVVAGPFIDGGDKRGLYIFNVTEIADAETLVMTDPAVEAGIFTAEFTKFYGSAALLTVGETHLKIQKKAVQ